MDRWYKILTPGESGGIVQMRETKANRFCREMIFGVAETIAFLSQGTTLEKGTIIMTGTGPGIGAMRDPKIVLKDGDDIRIQVDKIGTLINTVYYE